MITQDDVTVDVVTLNCLGCLDDSIRRARSENLRQRNLRGAFFSCQMALASKCRDRGADCGSSLSCFLENAFHKMMALGSEKLSLLFEPRVEDLQSHRERAGLLFDCTGLHTK